MSMRDGYLAVMAAVALAWTLPPDITVSQWADQHRVLPDDSAEPGQWRTSRNPLLREPMDALSDHHPCSTVTTMACSQDGKSEILNNWAGYTVHHSPASFLLVQPDEKAAERYSKKRIGPMLEKSQVPVPTDVLGLLDPGESQKKQPLLALLTADEVLDKYFPGGFIMLAGAGSASALASTPIERLALDEIDKFPTNVQGQGSARKQAEQRSVTYVRSKKYYSSTPIKLPLDDEDAVGGSEIWRLYQAGSRAHYHVPCPHCHQLQELLFQHLRWEKEIDAKGVKRHKPETAVYMCQAEGCGLAIEEHHKTAMLADAPMGGTARWVHERPWITDHLSYHWNALYTPFGLGRSWADIAKEWLEACRDRSKLMTFWNLILGLPFDDHADRLSEKDMEQAAENYPLRQVLPGYFILGGSVDVQTDHLDFMVRAWGPNERNHVVDRVKIYGDLETEEPWAKLTKLRHETFPNCAGFHLRIVMTAIDTGGDHTQRVYKYLQQNRNDNVIGVKGHSLRKQPILGKPSKKEAKNGHGIAAKYGLSIWMVGTDTAKEALFLRLADWADHPLGSPTVDQRLVRLTQQLGPEFFRELTAEVYNQQTGLWDKIRTRNEALDLLVYGHAAVCHPHVRVDKLTATDWALYAQHLEPLNHDLFNQAAAPSAEPESAAVGAALAAPAQQQAPAPSPAPQPAPEPQPRGWLDGTDDWLN
ncbi:phage terminase large subunit family protein [Roseateles sp. DC23W]|uniref:Phage terminase large subunit family protein n=1 Tax=Pelomonas dachongensis TaxID=3299029 RepID=A0ABW7EK30_9BURK